MEKKLFLYDSLSKSELIGKIIELEGKFEDKIVELENKLEEKAVLLEEKDVLINTLKEELEKQNSWIKRHSQNSNQPPSTDLYEKKPKPKSERQKSGKKTGGQPGHEGITLRQVENPDVIKNYDPNECKNCAYNLSEVEVDEHIKYQEFEIPVTKVIVTEHRRASKTCPSCKTVTTAEGPSHIKQPVQYGARVQTLANYLVYEQFVPVKRVQDLFRDVFSLNISQGSLITMHERMSSSLRETVYRTLYEEILNSDVVHFDETGMRVKGKTHWLHSASTSRATIYLIHQKRGQEAMNALNILPNYKGVAVHDNWAPYSSYRNAQHSLCNAHHRRELRGMNENCHQAWTQEMRSLLDTILESVKEYKNAGKSKLPEDILTNYSEQYDSILEKACSEIPKLNQPTGPKKRGKVKRHPADNLRNRLVTYKTETLRFMYDFAVPFTNNQAEQDVRMAKVKQKISGCFRSPEGANRFCTIRSYISTAKKRGISVFAALENAARGQPETFSS